ncbi:MAG: GntR family transcriptional regulator [Bacillota bacterium]|nr:GntR family transcriptional regulator [Bacillota bacterium]
MKKHKLNNKEIKSKLVYDRLYRKIIYEEIPNNTKLIVSEIAYEYGVSEIPVREALKRLNSDGLIDYIPFRGYIVSNFTLEKLRDLWVIKVNLELFASKLAVETFTDNDIKTLNENIRKTKELIHNEEYHKFFRLNKDFHLIFCGICGNSLLVDMIKSLWDKTEKLRGPYPFSKNDILESVSEHEEMIMALKSKDVSQIELLVHQQRDKIWDRYFGMFERHKYLLR